MPTAQDCLAWLALGGLAQWGVLIRRWWPRGEALLVPPGVWPLMALGALGLLARSLGPMVGPTAPGAVLEAWGGHPVVGPTLLVAGLLGWALAARGTRAGDGRPFWGRVAVAALPVALGAPWAMMPPWAPDESLYHLSLSLHGLFGGALWAPPGHGNGGFFALGDHFAGLGLWMGSVPAARGAQIWSVIFAGEAVWALLPALGTGAVLVAQSLFLGCPVVLWQLGCAYVDIMHGAFVLVAAALFGCSCMGEARRNGAARAGCGWLLGCAVGCKVLAVVWLPPFAAWVVWQNWRRGPSGLGWGSMAVLAAVTCLPFAPDVAHNLWRYHAPLFPFGAPLWPGGEALSPSQVQALHTFLNLHGPTWDGVPLTGWRRYVALPYALIFAADFASPRFDGVVGALPLVWLGASLGAWAASRRRAPAGASAALKRASHGAPTQALRTALQGAVLLPVAVWLCTSLQARFLIGPLWAMAWLTVLLWLEARSCAPWAQAPRAQGLALGALALLTGLGSSALVGHMPPLSLGAWGKSAPERHHDRLRTVPASVLCDGVPAAAGSRVMLVWSQRLSLFCLGDQVADSYDEGASLKEALGARCDQEEACAAAAAAVLRGRGITHMLVHEGRTQEDFTSAQWQSYLALRTHALVPVAAWQSSKLYALAALPPPNEPSNKSPQR